MNVDGGGRNALASFTTKTCSSDELAISHIEIESQELQHQEEDRFSKLRTTCGRATTAIIDVDGVGLRVRIAAKCVGIICVSSFCSALSVCFRLVISASTIAYDQIEIFVEFL